MDIFLIMDLLKDRVKTKVAKELDKPIELSYLYNNDTKFSQTYKLPEGFIVAEADIHGTYCATVSLSYKPPRNNKTFSVSYLLELSHTKESHIEELVNDFIKVVKDSLNERDTVTLDKKTLPKSKDGKSHTVKQIERILTKNKDIRNFSTLEKIPLENGDYVKQVKFDDENIDFTSDEGEEFAIKLRRIVCIISESRYLYYYINLWIIGSENGCIHTTKLSNIDAYSIVEVISKCVKDTNKYWDSL